MVPAPNGSFSVIELAVTVTRQTAGCTPSKLIAANGLLPAKRGQPTPCRSLELSSFLIFHFLEQLRQ